MADNDVKHDKRQEQENLNMEADVRAFKHEDEEYAAEIAPERPVEARQVDRVDDDVRTGARLGWFALILSIAAFFIWPVLLGPGAAIAGVYAYREGSRSLGIWSIALGLIAFVAYLFTAPFY